MPASSLGLRVALLALVAAPLACRYQPTPVQLQASPSDIEALAGRWEGEFSSVESGRSGNIVFTVQAGKDTAFGDVVMIPQSWGQPLTAADAASGEHARHSASAELLRVRFVRAHGDFIEGALEPYIAPDCHCTVSTTFHGALQGNSIRGDYVTTGAYGLRQTGKWSVTRKPPRQEIAK